MGFNTATGRAEYTAVAAQTDFDFVFKIYIDEDIIAWLTPTDQEPNDVDDLLVLGVDYTITVNGDDGGVFTLLSAATAGDYVTLVRNLSPKRFVEYAENGDLRPAVLNADQNYQTYLVADSLTAFDKVVRLPENSQDTSGELPAPVGDAYLKWAADGKSLENDTTIPDAVTTAADSVLDAGSWSDEDEDVKVQVFTDRVGEDRVPTVYSSKHHAAKSLGFATVSESEAWEAEAEALTALSIAMEAEDTPINLVTSDGDGTFTYTPQAGVFSSLHWAAKAATFNPALFALKDYVDIKPTGQKNTILNSRKLVQQRGVNGGRKQVILNTANLGGHHTISFLGTATVTIKEASTLGASDALTSWDTPLATNVASGTFVTLTSNKYVHVEFSTTDFSSVQLERGSIATRLELRHNELDLCSYFYQHGTYSEVHGYSQAAIVLSGWYINVVFQKEMRVIPLVAHTNAQGTSAVNNVTAIKMSIGRSNTVANRTNNGTYTLNAEIFNADDGAGINYKEDRWYV